MAAEHGLSMDAVIASNGMRNAGFLSAGRKIRLPNMDGIPYTVKKGDTYKKIAKKYDVPVEVILDANDVQSDDIEVGRMLFIPGARMPASEFRAALGKQFIEPVKGSISSGYGWRISPITHTRMFHGALDIAVRSGTPVKAAADGTIAATGTNMVYGNFIIMTHARGFQSMYAHLSAIEVKKGQQVSQGGEIGKSGSTGESTGPHVHFALYKNGKAINPLAYIR
jgi:murein DD-endopeptidase MepM/ murein hydrolase activator NlpD